MNTHRTLLGAWAAVAVLAPLAHPAGAQTRPAIAAAGSPFVVQGGYLDGVVTRLDAAARTITIGADTYPVKGANPSGVSVGDRVTVTFVVEHYGPAAHRVVLGVERTDGR